ncbi:AraC family transcriptional regulator [Deminuibacter soli]|nr:helix-turn-helix domain-containing protein [Deminuibacter soli]
MQYTLLPPPAALRQFVQYCWTLEEDCAGTATKVFKPLADGCPGLVFQQETGVYHDEEQKRLPGIFLYGQTIKPREMHLSGQLKTFGVVFYPHAVKSVFGMDAGELTDTCVDLDFLARGKGFRLNEQLNEAASGELQLGALTAYLQAEQRLHTGAADAGMDYAIDAIIRSNGNVPLKTLHRQLYITERSFERWFSRYVGIAPSVFAKVCRFQAALQQMRSNQYHRLTDIAFDNGYADQSHFIRQFKAFAGCSPNQFQQKTTGVVSNFPVLIQ